MYKILKILFYLLIIDSVISIAPRFVRPNQDRYVRPIVQPTKPIVYPIKLNIEDVTRKKCNWWDIECGDKNEKNI